MNEGGMMIIYYDTFTSKWGDMLLAKSDKGLSAAQFIENAKNFSVNDVKHLLGTKSDIQDIIKNPDQLQAIKQQFTEYFSGSLKSFDLEFDLQGTDFQKTVWNILLTIPYGEVWSYQDVAIKAGDANKVRAVGGAVGKNPVVIAIPCHRVVGKSGKLTGFSSLGGTELKQKILDHEGIDLNSGADYQIPLI